MKRMLGMPETSREPPGIAGIPWARPWDPEDASGIPGHTAGTPRGRPCDSLVTPLGHRGPLWDRLWTTKTIISRQIDSARSSQLLCSKLPMRAHRMNDSTGPFSR